MTNLTIQLYKDKALDATVWAATCVYDRATKSAVSDSAVRLEKGNMTVSGVGFRWDSERQRIEILDQAVVLLNDASFWSLEEKP